VPDMTINEIMNELRLRYGDVYDVRLVPSTLLGGGHNCRATIDNIRKTPPTSATHPSSYRLALNEAYRLLLERANG